MIIWIKYLDENIMKSFWNSLARLEFESFSMYLCNFEQTPKELDVWNFYQIFSSSDQLKFGITADRTLELLDLWKKFWPFRKSNLEIGRTIINPKFMFTINGTSKDRLTVIENRFSRIPDRFENRKIRRVDVTSQKFQIVITIMWIHFWSIIMILSNRHDSFWIVIRRFKLNNSH